MKFSLQRGFLLFAFVGLALMKPLALRAQEFEASAADSIKTRITEETLYSAEDERSVDRSPVTTKDSVLTRPHHQTHQRAKITSENPTRAEKRKAEKDDSIMSFNFLYYMIKKFKLSDIVDDE